MTKFDLAKTQELQDLFAMGPSSRDQHWTQKFFQAVPDASLRSQNPQVIQGPDGFPYFYLAMPIPQQPFESFSVSHVMPICLKEGFGITLFGADPRKPEWVFTYGDLSSYKSYGRFDGDPADEPADFKGHQEEVVKEARQIMIGAPSESFLPTEARRVIRNFLERYAKIENPGVALVSDPALKPSRSLVFNFYADQFKQPEAYGSLMSRLIWFLPRKRGLIGMDRSSIDPANFLPL